MVTSKAKTVAEYMEEVPEERRAALKKVRAMIRKNLPKGYREIMGSGMISYGIPLETYPDTYNKQPLCYAALAAQKNHHTLYLMGVYMNPPLLKRLEKAFEDSGNKLDMGKSCIHFKTADDLPLDALGEIIASIPADRWIEIYESSRKKKK